jgi:hypothetical protein
VSEDKITVALRVLNLVNLHINPPKKTSYCCERGLNQKMSMSIRHPTGSPDWSFKMSWQKEITKDSNRDQCESRRR